MHIKIYLTAFALMAALMSTSVAMPESEDVDRIAVVDVGEEQETSEAFIDLLEMRLLEQEDKVVLLERQKIDKLLREQRLGLLIDGEVNSMKAVQAGKLLGVDAFLLVEGLPKRKRKTHPRVRVRLVDTRYGIKLDDLHILIDGTDRHEFMADRVADRIGSLLPRIRKDLSDMILVGVAGFKSIEPTSRLDYLSGEMGSAIEHQLALQPGIIVAERQKLEPLREERNLVSGLPAALRASTIFLDGEYHLKGGDPDTLAVFVRARRNGWDVFTERFEGPLNSPSDLSRQIARTVAENLGNVGVFRIMNPVEEADMLLEHSRAASSYADKIGAIQAAMALMPDHDKYKFAYLSAVYDGMYSLPLSRKRDPETGGPNRRRMQDVHRYVSMLERMSKEWARNSEYPPPKQLTQDLHRLLIMLYFLESDDLKLDEVHDLLEGRLRPVIERMRADLLPESPGEETEYGYLSDIFYVWREYLRPKTADAALEIYNRYAARNKGTPKVIGLSGGLKWPLGIDKATLFELERSFYESLLNRGEPFERLAGLKGLAHIYFNRSKATGDYASAREHYERFESYCLQEYVAGRCNPDQLWFHPFLRFPGSQFYADKEADLQYRADRTARILTKMLHNPEKAVREQWMWNAGNIRVLEEAEQFERAERIVTKYIEATKKFLSKHRSETWTHIIRSSVRKLEKYRKRLQKEHPKLVDKEDTGKSSKWEARELFSLKDGLQGIQGGADISHLSGKRLVLEHGMAAIIGPPGVLFLDPQSLSPVRFEKAPEGMVLGKLYGASDKGVYIPSCKGIAFFPRKGDPQMFFKEHPDLTEDIRGMDVVDGKVYLLVGKSGQLASETLIEFDFNKRERKILLSAKSSAKDQALKGLSGIYNIAADPVRNRLRVFVKSAERHRFFAYYPDSGEFKGISDFGRPTMSNLEVRRRGTELMTKGTIEVSYLDMKRNDPIVRIYARSVRFEPYHAMARVSKGLIGILHGDINYFPEGGSEPENIRGEIFPPSGGRPPSVRDMCMHRRGLLILGMRGLYLVPGIKELIKVHFKEPMDTEDVLQQWRRLPMLEKIRSYYKILKKFPWWHTPARIRDEAMLMSLEGIKPSKRKKCILAFLDHIEGEKIQRHHPSHRWIKQMKPAEWRDPDIQDAIAKVLTSMYSEDPYLWELFKQIPADVELEGWDKKVGSTQGRPRMAILAMLVKTGQEEFAEALIGCDPGPHVSFRVRNVFASPHFHAIQPKLVLAAAKTIEERGQQGGRPNIKHLMTMATLRESREALAPYIDSSNQTLAMAVCFMLVNDGKDEYLPRLRGMLADADIETIAQYKEKLIRLILRLRANALLKPEQSDRYHDQILILTEYLFRIYEKDAESDEDGNQRNAQLASLAKFIVDDLQRFNIYPEIPEILAEHAKGLEKFCNYENAPTAVAHALVNEARQRGGLEGLMAKQRESITADDDSWGPRLLLMHMRRFAGHPEPLEMFREGFGLWLKREDCPRSFIEEVWLREPEQVIRILSLADLMENVDIYNRNLGSEIVQMLLNRLETKGDRQTTALFRLVHGLPLDEMPEWSFASRKGNRRMQRVAGLDSPVVCESDWTPELLAAGRSIIGEHGYAPLDRLTRFLNASAKLFLKSPRTRESMKKSDGIVADFIRGMLKLHEGDMEQFLAFFEPYVSSGKWKPTPYRMKWFETMKWRADLVRGRRLDSLEDWWSGDGAICSRYELLYTLIESGQAQAAWRLLQPEYASAAQAASSFRKYIPCHLAWLAARTGHWDAARTIAMEALINPGTPNTAEYALMQIKLLAERPPELEEYVDILDLRPWESRPEYSKALAKFAQSARHPDLKALAAFQAGRIAYTADRLTDARRLWKAGHEAEGLHSGYCRAALDALSAERPPTKVTTAWYAENAAPPRLLSIEKGFGITSRDGDGQIRLRNFVILDPYGVPVSNNRRLEINCRSSGWWMHFWDEPPAWLHGGWTIVAPHDNGTDVHHRTLVPFK